MDKFEKRQIDDINNLKQQIKTAVNELSEVLYSYGYSDFNIDIPYIQLGSVAGKKRRIYDVEIEAIKRI